MNTPRRSIMRIIAASFLVILSVAISASATTMTKGAVITGRVTDQRGEPVVAIRVTAVRIRDEAGKGIRATQSGSGDITDDRGVYRIHGLSTGTYIVGVNILRAPLEVTAYDEDVPVYHPSSERAGASEVSVIDGSESTGIDISYRRDRGHIVSGTIKFEDSGTGSIDVAVRLRERASSLTINSVSVDNYPIERQFTLRAVPDGDYILTASSQRGRGQEAVYYNSERQRVIVRGGDSTGINVIMGRRSGMSGSVVIEPAPTPLPPACQQLSAGAAEKIVVKAAYIPSGAEPEPTGYSEWESSVQRNQFSMPNLLTGQYRLTFNLPGELWYPRIITAPEPGPGARRIVELGANFLKLNFGESIGGITVTLAAGAASVMGRVDITNGRARIHLIPVEPPAANQILRYAETTSDREGRFQLRHLAPGRYYAVAITINDQSQSTSQPPKAWDEAERVQLRRLAEAAKTEIELQPCQRRVDYQLSPIVVKK